MYLTSVCWDSSVIGLHGVSIEVEIHDVVVVDVVGVVVVLVTTDVRREGSSMSTQLFDTEDGKQRMDLGNLVCI